MNKKSGVHVRFSDTDDEDSSLDLEAVKLVSELTDSLDTSFILSQGVCIEVQRVTILIELLAKSWVEQQHIVCRKAWKDIIDSDSDDGHSLLGDLATIARREALITWSARQGRLATRQNVDHVKEARSLSASISPLSYLLFSWPVSLQRAPSISTHSQRHLLMYWSP
jgi:hypothetical protein